jgi:hypothetical protein
MKAGSGTSRFALSNLAIRSALDLERFRAGRALSAKTMSELADALTQTSDPDPEAVSARFFEVGYHKPFMRLYKDRNTVDPRSVAEVQEYLHEMALEIREFLRHPEKERINELASFCTDLHHELASGLMSETVIGRRGTPGDGSPSTSLF